MALFQNILVAVDFSPHARKALRVSGELARALGARVTALHVFQVPVYPLPEGAFVLPARELAAARTEAVRLLDAARGELGPAATTEIVDGVPFAEIVRYAREHDHDLIVLGTHGRTGLKHALLGSVAEKVMRKAPCAVMAVRLGGERFEQP